MPGESAYERLKRFGFAQEEEQEEEEEPIREGEFKEVKPSGRIARSIGRGLGRGLGKAAGGAGEFGRGFMETAPRIPRPTSKGAGRFVGWGAKEAWKYVSGRKETRRRKGVRVPSSRLPVPLQVSITDVLSIDHPQIYSSLFYEGITFSELIGTLREDFPTVYFEIREETG